MTEPTYPPRFAEYAAAHRLSPAEALARDTRLNPRAALAPFYDWLLEQKADEQFEAGRERHLAEGLRA